MSASTTTNTLTRCTLLFYAQVPKNMNEEDIFPTFDGFGPLKDVAIIRDRQTGMHRGCAFVTFWNSADADRAREALHDKFTFPGAKRCAQVKRAEPSGGGKSPGKSFAVAKDRESVVNLFCGRGTALHRSLSFCSHRLHPTHTALHSRFRKQALCRNARAHGRGR